MRWDSSCPWRRNGRSPSRIVPSDRWLNKWRATRMGPQVEARGAETSGVENTKLSDYGPPKSVKHALEERKEQPCEKRRGAAESWVRRPWGTQSHRKH